jgi:hypothetical protein
VLRQISTKTVARDRRIFPARYQYLPLFHVKQLKKLDKILRSSVNLHSNSKFRVSATEAFRKTTFTEVSSSKNLPETSGFRTETSGFSNRNFGFLKIEVSCF